MVVQIQATELTKNRSLIAEYEFKTPAPEPADISDMARQFARRELDKLERKNPSNRIYQLDNVEVIK